MDREIRSRTGVPGPGIDVRAEGGYAIVPPSVRNDGIAYEWENPPGLFEISAAPDWLIALVCRRRRSAGARATPAPVSTDHHQAVTRTERYVERVFADEVDRVRTAAAGARNEQLNRSAFSLGQFVGSDLLERDRVACALLEAASVCGLVTDDGECAARATITSGLAGCRTVSSSGSSPFSEKPGPSRPSYCPEPQSHRGDAGRCTVPLDRITVVGRAPCMLRSRPPASTISIIVLLFRASTYSVALLISERPEQISNQLFCVRRSRA